MAQSHTELQLSRQGRVVIPVALHRALGLGPGDTLLAHLEDGRLVLDKPEAVRRRLKARFAGVQDSFAEELIAERRIEAERENR